ncbi:hypothetical protein FDP41_001848 [Naegleria fowleri]|uniref:Uncharacterized protein n=1 Tax=Naegleria fowleri TaxID=5763 RepID=A0A6A5BYJ9_NAEFO|nr:uncharacterized protein FDP41_001848 [Naegleria fowleri]KAF0978778.1 hypothetical protein FDP41_001848 [Naegleria fowleri]
MFQQLKENASNFFDILSYVYSFLTEGYDMNRIYKITGATAAGALALYLGKVYFNGGMVDRKLFQHSDLSSRVTIVTGASYGGIGYETAKVMYELGSDVVLAVRDQKAGEFAKKLMMEEPSRVLLPTNTTQTSHNQQSPKKKGQITVMTIDLTDLESVKKFAQEFKKNFQRCDYLINNAGIMMCPHSVTKQGIEIQFGTNHLGHFLLTQLLLDMIMACNGRIINVSSIASIWLLRGGKKDIEGFCSFKENVIKGDGKDLADIYELYGRSKLANVLFSKKLAREFSKTNTSTSASTYSVHPGAVRTNLTRHMGSMFNLIYAPLAWYFSKSPWQGAQTTLQVSLAPQKDLLNGGYYADAKLAKPNAFSDDQALQDTLYETSLKLCEPYLKTD